MSASLPKGDIGSRNYEYTSAKVYFSDLAAVLNGVQNLAHRATTSG